MSQNNNSNPEYYNITNYTVNKDGSISVHDNVDLSNRQLTEIPFNFHHVQGKFDVSDNLLTSLKNCPTHCNDLNICGNYLLKTIDNFRLKVQDTFSANNTKISSLDNLPLATRIYMMETEVEDTSFLSSIVDHKFSHLSLNKNKITKFLHPRLVVSKVLSLSFNQLTNFDVSELCGLIRIEGSSLTGSQLQQLQLKKYKIESFDTLLKTVIDKEKSESILKLL